jgi:hypothetical protein
MLNLKAVQVKQFKKQQNYRTIGHPKESTPNIIEVVIHVLKYTQWFTVSCIAPSKKNQGTDKI